MRTITKHTKAFTMIELVFVIVVLGILAALALPRMDRDLRQEAADNILSAIRYTQHLALNDDKTNPFNPNWQQELWTIRFKPDGSFYTVSSNTNHENNADNVNKTETAIDPMNGKYMYSNDNTIDGDESPNIFLAQKYGVNSVEFEVGGAAATEHIAFDHLGRPYKSGIYSLVAPYAGYMTDDCTITIEFVDSDINDLIITIEKETGYAYIEGQEDS